MLAHMPHACLLTATVYILMPRAAYISKSPLLASCITPADVTAHIADWERLGRLLATLLSFDHEKLDDNQRYVEKEDQEHVLLGHRACDAASLSALPVCDWRTRAGSRTGRSRKLNTQAASGTPCSSLHADAMLAW